MRGGGLGLRASTGSTPASLQAAALQPELHGETVEIVVVLDSCTDGTAREVAHFSVVTLTTQARNVGVGRSLGAGHLIARGARWLSSTGADTVVAGDWLVARLALGADAACGSIAITDCEIHGDDAPYPRLDFDSTYRDVDGHGHAHGANLGVSAVAYGQVDAFPPLPCHEDVASVERPQQARVRIAFSAACVHERPPGQPGPRRFR